MASSKKSSSAARRPLPGTDSGQQETIIVVNRGGPVKGSVATPVDAEGAVDGLPRLETPERIKVLIHRLNDAGIQVRTAAIDALTECGLGAVSELVQALEHGDQL